jgi:hypothetical protein
MKTRLKSLDTSFGLKWTIWENKVQVRMWNAGNNTALVLGREIGISTVKNLTLHGRLGGTCHVTQ